MAPRGFIVCFQNCEFLPEIAEKTPKHTPCFGRNEGDVEAVASIVNEQLLIKC